MHKILFFLQGYQSLLIIEDLIKNDYDLDIVVSTFHPEYNLLKNHIIKFKNLYYAFSKEDFFKLFDTLISKCKYDYIWPGFSDKDIEKLSIVNEKLDLPGLKKKTFDKISEKKIYYNVWKELKIPIPAIWQIVPSKECLENVTNLIKYPCIVKPSKGMFSLGIKIINDELSLKDFFADVDRKVHEHQESKGDKFKHFEYYSADSDYIIQEYIDGNIVSLMGHVSNKKVSIDFVYDIESKSFPYAAETGFIYPSNVSQELLNKILCSIRKFVLYIDLDNSPFMFDIIISGNDFYFIDFAARLSAGYSLLTHSGEKKYVSKLVDSILNKSNFKIDCQNHCIKRCLPLPQGKLKSFVIDRQDLADYIKYPTDNKINLLRNDLAVTNNGFVFIVGKNKNECELKYETLINSIRVEYE